MFNLSNKGQALGFILACLSFYSPILKSEEVISSATQTTSSNPYPSSSSTYLDMANHQEGEEKQNSLLRAAGRMMMDGQWQQSLTILSQTQGLSELQRSEKEIILAQAFGVQNKPKLVIEHLKSIKQVGELPAFQQLEYHRLLANAYQRTNKPLASLSERIQLDSLLTEDSTSRENQRQIWMTLMSIPQKEIEALAIEPQTDTETKGWLQLAVISRQFRNNGKSLLAALDQWQTQYNSHRANHFLPYPLDSVVNKMIAEPKQIALLLPLSGPFSGPGHSVKEGFMAAYKAHSKYGEIEIKTYDTSKGEIKALYQKAIADGAEFVVGPLLKKQVAVIAELPHPVPTLLLNESDTELQENSYIFGLSPTAEAVQVAMKASSQGLHNALVIAPNSEWGNEIVRAFTRQWVSEGGRVSDQLLYSDKDDLNQKVKEVLHLTQSAEREKKIKQFLGYQIESFPSRRQDVDMVFLLAYPSRARQIVPLLKYYYANDIPVYATSSVYSGNANALKDKDLDGIVFCDIPWVFSHQMGARNWPEQFNSHNRLYALGKNSYELSTQLNQLLLFPADGNKDEGGVLYLMPNQQVARVFEWGQFKQGLAHSLG